LVNRREYAPIHLKENASMGKRYRKMAKKANGKIGEARDGLGSQSLKYQRRRGNLHGELFTPF